MWGGRIKENSVWMGKAFGWKLACYLLIILLAGSAAALAQQDKAQLEENIGNYEALLKERQANLDALSQQLSETNVKLDAQLAERERLAARVLELGQTQESLRERSRQLKRQRQVTALRIRTLSRDAEALKGRMQELIVSLHKGRSGRVFGVLSKSASFFRLRVQSDYLKRLTEQDVVLLDTFNKTTAALKAARVKQARQLKQLASKEQQLTQSQTDLEAARKDLESAISALSRTRAGQMVQRESLLREQNTLEDDLGNAREALARELERLRSEAAAAAAEAEAARAAEADTAFAGEAQRLQDYIASLSDPAAEEDAAGYALPFPGAKVVRRYGDGGATDAWLAAKQAGSAVRAIKGGLVYRASQITANSGYTVAIQHGPKLISAYSNLQFPVVQFGDQVKAGQIIGYLGGGIVAPDILQLRVGRPDGFDIIYQDPAPLLGLKEP